MFIKYGCHQMCVQCLFVRHSDTIELNVGDEVEFSLLDSSTKPVAENMRKLKTGTILSMVGDQPE